MPGDVANLGLQSSVRIEPPDGRGRARLALGRPAKRNALDGQLIRELDAALAALAAMPRLRTLLLSGDGETFCGGADLAYMQALGAAPEAENRREAEALAALLRRLDEFPVPVVARVQGGAFGGGAGLLACCDVVIASDAARFSFSEVRLGLVPATISPFVLRAIGERAARRWFLSGEAFDAPTAVSMGLVHECVPAAGLDAQVERELARLGGGGPQAQREAKTLIRRLRAGAEPAALAHETSALLARLRVSPEGQEGMRAFLERRRPGWLADQEDE